MNLTELTEKLRLNNVPKHIYSLYEGEKPDAYILTKNYSVWEYFYMSERGQKMESKTFNEEEKAFEFFWEQIKIEISTPLSKFPKWD